MKKTLALILALSLSLALASCGNPNQPSNSGTTSTPAASTGTTSTTTPPAGGSGETVTLATGGTSGTYYAYGGVMQTTLNPLLTTGQLNVTSTGASSANILEVADGNAQMSILQSDVLSYAHSGTDLFTEAETSSQWVAGLYNETVQIISAPGIKDVSELKGKTVCVGDVGSGTEVNARQVLEAYGMTTADITATNGSFGDAANDLKDGKIDAAFTVAGAPTTSITELDATAEFDMISLTPEAVEYLTTNYPFLVQEDLPAGTYEYVDAGFASEEDAAALKAKYPDGLAGKIALVSRGNMTYQKKVENLYDLKPAGIVVYNNVSVGSLIAMNLTTQDMPAAFISQADGQAMLDAPEHTLSIAEGQVLPQSTIYEASEFSAWGVSPDLRLKPEIAAPGGRGFLIDTGRSVRAILGHVDGHASDGGRQHDRPAARPVRPALRLDECASEGGRGPEPHHGHGPPADRCSPDDGCAVLAA